MPNVDDGKCSVVAEEKDFCSDRMRSAFRDSNACCWASDAFYRESDTRCSIHECWIGILVLHDRPETKFGLQCQSIVRLLASYAR